MDDRLSTLRKHLMKKTLVFSVGFIFMASIAASCSGHGAGDKAREDSIRGADSIALVQAATHQTREDSLMQDSVLEAQARELYPNAISIEPGKKDKQLVHQSSFYKIDWTCTLKNNSGIVITPSDYQVVYEETFTDGDAGSLFDVTKERTLKGMALQPDSTAQVVLTGRANTQELSNPHIRMLIPEEDFIQRYKTLHSNP